VNAIIYPLHLHRSLERRWTAKMKPQEPCRLLSKAVEICIAKQKSLDMKRSESMRKNAKACLNLQDAAHTEAARKRFRRMKDGWLALADAQDWLDGVICPLAQLPTPS
jgi:hypothetical protein